jgi:hypothetical protein
VLLFTLSGSRCRTYIGSTAEMATEAISISIPNANLGLSENRMFERQIYPLRTLRKYTKCDRYWQKK